MTSSLSNLVNSFSEEIYEIKYKYGHDDQKCETCGKEPFNPCGT